MGKALPSVYAGRQLSDGRWEILASDDDPFRPPWRRIAVVPCSTARLIGELAPRRTRGAIGAGARGQAVYGIPANTRRENLRLQTELLASQERVFELQGQAFVIAPDHQQRDRVSRGVNVMPAPLPPVLFARNDKPTDVEQAARALLQLIEQERAGTFDGYGHSWWTIGDPILSTAKRLVFLAETRAAEWRDAHPRG